MAANEAIAINYSLENGKNYMLERTTAKSNHYPIIFDQSHNFSNLPFPLVLESVSDQIILFLVEWKMLPVD